MTKIVLYPTPVTLSKSVLWPSKEKEKKKRKERKKEAAHIIKKYVFKSKTSETKSSCHHSGP